MQISQVVVRERCSRSVPLAALIVLLFLAETSFAAPIIAGHLGSGSIATFDFATGQQIASFVTDGAAIDGRGRGVEVVGNTVYYSAVGGDGIHVALYNNGSGGPDFAIIANPRPGHGIQDLDYRSGVLYALTGYATGPPIVYRLNPNTGAVIGLPVAILNHPNIQADGFTVLPNGNFLINDGDASATYREYDSSTGIATGSVITLPALGGLATGVEYNPSDNSLYFNGRFVGANPGLARTTLNGTFLGIIPISTDEIEDISIVQPVPSPAVSKWGLGALAILLFSGVAIKFARRPARD